MKLTVGISLNCLLKFHLSLDIWSLSFCGRHIEFQAEWFQNGDVGTVETPDPENIEVAAEILFLSALELEMSWG